MVDGGRNITRQLRLGPTCYMLTASILTTFQHQRKRLIETRKEKICGVHTYPTIFEWMPMAPIIIIFFFLWVPSLLSPSLFFFQHNLHLNTNNKVEHALIEPKIQDPNVPFKMRVTAVGVLAIRINIRWWWGRIWNGRSEMMVILIICLFDICVSSTTRDSPPVRISLKRMKKRTTWQSWE